MEEMCRNLLLAKGYEVFLPTFTREHRRGRHLHKVLAPLFPSYLFCRLTDESVGRIVSTPGVCKIVGVGRTPVTIQDEEIESLKKVSVSVAECAPCRYLPVGCRIRIISGPLSSVEGVLVDTPRGKGLVASIEILQRSVCVVLDETWKIMILKNGEAQDTRPSALPQAI